MPFIPESERLSIIKFASDVEPGEALVSLPDYADLVPSLDLVKYIDGLIARDSYPAITQAQIYMGVVPEAARSSLLSHAAILNPDVAVEEVENYMGLIPINERFNFLSKVVDSRPGQWLAKASEVADFLPEEQRLPFILNLAVKSLSQEDTLIVDRGFLARYLDGSVIERLEKIATRNEAFDAATEVINDLHDVPDAAVRFKSIANYSGPELYRLIVRDIGSMYTSTYLGVFDRLAQKLRTSHQNIDDIEIKTSPQSILVFLEAAASYNRLPEALKLIPGGRWEEILKIYAENIANSGTSSLMTLADIMRTTPDAQLRTRIEQFVQQQYDGLPAGQTRDAYGILAAYYNSAVGQGRIKLADADVYKINPILSLETKAYVGEDNIHRQLVIFYDDKDGIASYDSFIKRYTNNEKYKIKDAGDYVIITSVPGHGAKVGMQIYANKPGTTPEGVVSAVGGKEKFNSVVHRGHSTHLHQSMPYFSSNNALMFLGSCGGYQSIGDFLDISPAAHIVSTKGTGSMGVNDPLLYHLNELMRTGQPVVWSKVQTVLNGFGSIYKESYVLPTSNIVMAMQSKLSELKILRAREKPLDLIESAGRSGARLGVSSTPASTPH